ncbi:hypothetical protein HNY73_000833 [Argiope bruennichi]|uniref:Uncharacterized protein n=1 Tax=Argiope bruennichi TaxID=94029 RepID=A0A8T0G0F3_ARGBR|nr:hypothetical protein HNY73_000833 [Argiope bruennichi]
MFKNSSYEENLPSITALRPSSVQKPRQHSVKVTSTRQTLGDGKRILLPLHKTEPSCKSEIQIDKGGGKEWKVKRNEGEKRKKMSWEKGDP